MHSASDIWAGSPAPCDLTIDRIHGVAPFVGNGGIDGYPPPLL